MTGPQAQQQTVEHIVARRGRTYRVLVPQDVVDAGDEELQAYVDDAVATQDATRAAAEARAAAAEPPPAPAALTTPDPE